MFKKIGIIITVLLFLSAQSQIDDQNKFRQSEQESQVENTSQTVNKGPTDPPYSPIGDYIPYLFVVAIGIIIYNTTQKKKVVFKNKSHY